jgi:hypothetical protein
VSQPTRDCEASGFTNCLSLRGLNQKQKKKKKKREPKKSPWIINAGPAAAAAISWTAGFKPKKIKIKNKQEKNQHQILWVLAGQVSAM